MDDLLFAKVNLPELDKQSAIESIYKIEDSLWFWDDYRATSMLPLMTKGAQKGSDGAINRFRTDEFRWIDYTPCVIKDWFDDIVFPWMGCKSRVMVLKTKSGFSNNEHIDCDPAELGTRQHKFRIVIKGKTDTLYFITSQGNIQVPNISGPFIMDGGWPHGMSNYTEEEKITIAVGAPWNGKDQYQDIEKLLSRHHHQMPDNMGKYFKI